MSKVNIIVCDSENVRKLIYKDGYAIDKSVFHRIKYLSSRDFDWYSGDGPKYFVVALIDSKIIGMAKVAYYSMNGEHKKDLSISFLSVDVDYRGNGYARMMTKVLFKHAKRNGYDIRTSTYTVNGKQQLQKMFNRYSTKYGVKFIDKDDDWGLIDAPHMYQEYNGLLVHKEEVRYKELS